MKNVVFKLSVSCGLGCVISLTRLFAAPGDLDSTFGDGGKLVFGFGGTADISRASATQSDGKLIVAGTSESRLTLVRFGTNNLPDPDFGVNGVATVDVSLQIVGLRVQTDGKIVVAGEQYNSNRDFALVRFNPDGSIDEDFASMGVMSRDYGAEDRCNNFLIDSSGRYVLVGTSEVSFPFSSSHLVLARFNENGNPDFSFNSTGSYIDTNYSTGYSVLRQSDGKLLVAGYSGGNCVLRFNDNGTPDTGFATGGKLNIPGATQLTALATQLGNNTVFQPDIYLVAGRTSVNGQNAVLLARFDPDGVLDTSFNGTGIVTQNIGGAANVIAMYVTGTLFSRRILIAGDMDVAGFDRFMAAKFTLAGALDSNFGNGGVTTTALSPGDDKAYNAILQGGGMLITGSTSPTNYYDSDFAAVRFSIGTGALDTNFFGTGVLLHNVGDLNASAKAVAVQNDGKIIIAGSAYYGPYGLATLTRLNPNGSRDLSFGIDGKVMSDIGGQSSEADAVALQPDGRVLIAGSAYDGKYYSVLVGRFLTNGVPDSSFGTNGFTITRVGTNYSSGTIIRLQPDGKILVGGSAETADADFLVLRYLANGALDMSWAENGKAVVGIGTGDDVLSGLALLPDGKVIASGYGVFVSQYKISLARFNSNGSLDASFGSFGRQALNLPGGGGNDAALGLTQQPDSKLILLCETFNATLTDADIGVARLTTNAVFDASFDGDGAVIQSIGLSVDGAITAAVQPDNKIVVGCRTTVGSKNRFGILRLLPNGSLDSSYGIGGRNYYDFETATTETLNALALDSIGRTVMVGDVNNVFGVLRVTGDTAFLLNFTAITRLGNGHIHLQGTGVPNGAHTLLGADAINGSYTPVSPVSADGLGDWEFEDTTASPDDNRFYRLSYP